VYRVCDDGIETYAHGLRCVRLSKTRFAVYTLTIFERQWRRHSTPAAVTGTSAPLPPPHATRHTLSR
jgi:hypothetical protein